MIEQRLRTSYQKFLVTPLAQRLKENISPNTITLVSGILGLLVVPALWLQQQLLAVMVLLLSGYFDSLDGSLARLQAKTTAWGSVFDIFTDRMVEFSVVYGLWLVNPMYRSFYCILMLGSILLCVTSFLVVAIFVENQSDKGFHYNNGIMERAEAFIFFILMIMVPAAFVHLALLFSFLVILTAVLRLHWFYKFSRV